MFRLCLLDIGHPEVGEAAGLAMQWWNRKRSGGFNGSSVDVLTHL